MNYLFYDGYWNYLVFHSLSKSQKLNNFVNVKVIAWKETVLPAETIKPINSKLAHELNTLMKVSYFYKLITLF